MARKPNTKSLFAKWNRILKREGLGEEPRQIHASHRMAPVRAQDLLSGRDSSVTVRLPSDDPNNPNVADRALANAVNRRAAADYHDTISEYLWRRCDWRYHPTLERLILEFHVVDGLGEKGISEAIGVTEAVVRRALKKHRGLAGIE